jgi:hypothetical protein
MLFEMNYFDDNLVSYTEYLGLVTSTPASYAENLGSNAGQRIALVTCVLQWFFSSLQAYSGDRYSKYVMVASFHILLSSLFTDSLMIRRHIF